MKKKFIAVSMVLGALALSSTTLTSCVDDNESASVTAIRDAKAKQLTALANYKDVQAQNEKIVAEAKAAIKNAEARWQEIQNDLKDLELQKAKATLETDIAAAQAKAEAALAAQQAILESAKAQLLQAADAVDLATKWRINNLIAAADAIMNGGNYYLYTDNVTVDPNTGQVTVGYGNNQQIYVPDNLSINGTGGLNTQLLAAKANKVKAEYDLTEVKLQIADYVREEQEDLAVNEALLKEYQNYSNEDRDAAYEAANEAAAKLASLSQKYEEAYSAWQIEESNITNAAKKVEATEIENFIVATPEASKYVQRQEPEPKQVIINYEDGTSYSYTISYRDCDQIVKIDEELLNKDIQSIERQIEIDKKAVENAQKEETDGKKDAAMVVLVDEGGQEIYNGTYKGLNDAIKKASEDFTKDPSTTNKNTLETLESIKAQYEKILADKVESCLSTQETHEKNLAKLKEIQTTLTGEAFKTYTTVYEAYMAAVDKSAEAYIAWIKTNYSWALQNQLVETLTRIAEGYTNWEDEINTLEQDINTNKKNIAAMTTSGTANGGTTEAEKQAYIDALDVEIARLEKEISIKQAQYDDYMSQVEALIQGEEAPAPETPAEGEETPAE